MKKVLRLILPVLLSFCGINSARAADTTSVVYSFWCSNGPVQAAVWYNDEVAVLVEGEAPSQRDQAKMEAFLDMMTALYAKYAEVTGLDSLPKENAWNGRIAVQIPNDNCGASGLASHGVLGISVGKSLFDEQQYNRSTSHQLQQVFFYEAHRNFWPEWFNNKFDWAMDNNPESWGWWTVGMNNAMVSIMAPLIGVEGMYGDQTGSEFRDHMVAQLRTCIDGKYNWSTGWTHAYMPWSPSESINDLMTGLLNYSVENFGGMEWLSGFYAGLRDTSIADRSDVMAHQECRDNVYRIWSAAAKENLSVFFEDTLKWPLSPAAKEWVAGRLGLGSIPAASERFAYSHLAAVHHKNGGLGWAGKWQLTSANGQARIQSGSLQYPGIAASGGRLRLEPATASPLLTLERNITPVDSGTVWIGFLVSAPALGSEPFSMLLNGNSQCGIGTTGGNLFYAGNETSAKSMQQDSVYWIVAKTRLGAGNDTVWLWVDPSPDIAPSETTADAVSHAADIGSLSGIVLSTAGPAVIDIDEIRLADAFGGIAQGVGIIPPAPGNLEGIVVSSTAVQLSWEDNAAIETGFRLQRKTSGVFTTIADLQPDVTNYNDTGLDPDSVYTYRIRAVGKGGVSPFSNSVALHTGQFGMELHAAEHFVYGAGPVDTKNGGEGWMGPWELVSGNGDAMVTGGSLRYPGGLASGGHLRLSPVSDEPEVILSRELPATDTGIVWIAYFVKGETVRDGHFFIRLNGNQNYALGKKWGNEFAIDNDGSGSVMNAGEVNLVVGRIVLSPAEDSISLWVNPSLAGEPGLSSASVRRVDTDLGTLTHVDVNLQGYGQGVYEIDALNIGRSFDEVIGKGMLPAAPSGLTSEVSAPDTVRLSWVDNAANETGFVLQRKTTGAFARVALLPANSTSYTDTVPSAVDSVYTYRVQAVNASGRSAFSTSVTAGGGADSVTLVAERFAYAANAGIKGRKKGMGWKSPWDVMAGEETLATVQAGSLKLPGIPASGGRLALSAGSAQPLALRRSFSARPDGVYWLSFLLAANAAGQNSSCVLLPGGEQAFAAGKGAGAGFMLGTVNTGIAMDADTAYNVVMKIVLQPGNDSVYMWVGANGPGEPATATAHAAASGADLGTLRFIDINMQAQTTQYFIDEIRIADTYTGAVTGEGMLPGKPDSLAVTGISPTLGILEWEANGNADGYHIDRKTPGGFERIGVAEAGATSYSLGGLWPDSTYTFRVRAFNDAGFSPFAGPVSLTTAAAQVMTPGPLQSDRRIIMWVSAHPDDELFGAHAAFARYLKDSLEIGYYVNVTSGSVQYNPSTSINYEHGTERMGEAYASAVSVGADNRFLGMIDGQVSASAGTLEERLTRAIREIQPDVIITHGPGGEYGNPDHVATSAAVTAAVTSAALPGAFPAQLAEGLKVWNTPKYYRIKYDPYPSADSLTLYISASDTSAALQKTYQAYADETLRASHQSADAAGIFDIYPVPDYTKASLHYEREDVVTPSLESSLLTGLPSRVERPLYLKNWVIAGPWPGNIGSSVLETDESAVTGPLGETDGGRTWTNYPDAGHSLVDFRRSFSENVGTVAYAYTEVNAAATTTFLRMAASNKYKIWLNGSLVASSASIPDYDYERHIPVTLAEGVNRILVKMESGPAFAGLARPWGFFMKIGAGASSPAPVPDGMAKIVVMPTESAYNMGEAVIGEGLQNTAAFIVQNTDMADSLAVDSIYLTGDNPGDYVIHDDSGETLLAPGGKRYFNVSFNPGAEGNKARVADIRILSGDVEKPEISIRIFGDALQPSLNGLQAKSAPAPLTEDREAVWLYPNPVSKVLRIDLPAKTLQHTSVKIVDMTGRERFAKKNIYTGEMMDVSGLEEGVYLVVIQIGNKTVVKKIVKIK